MRFTEEELATLRGVFKNNDALLKVLRKVFLPEIDPAAPIGQIVDLWMTVDIRNMMPEQAMVTLTARNQVIAHIEQQLMQIKVLANQEEPNAAEAAAAKEKDSVK